MSKLFQRECVVIVGGKRQNDTTNALRITDLHVSFDVKKNSDSHPNTAECKIYNLSKDSRSKVQEKGSPLIIQAGYTGTLATIFSGTVRLADHERSGSDWITTVRSGDGERQYKFASISESFGAGTPISTVLKALADKMKLTTNGNTRDLISGMPGKYLNGYVAHGKVSRILDQILPKLGYEWSVQNGELQVLKKGAHNTETIVSLSPSSGLIGSPEHGSGDGKAAAKHAGLVKLKSLLQPTLGPGRRVRIEAEAIQGTFRISKVHHEGDTTGGNWFSNLEVMPLGVKPPEEQAASLDADLMELDI